MFAGKDANDGTFASFLLILNTLTHFKPIIQQRFSDVFPVYRKGTLDCITCSIQLHVTIQLHVQS